jgi:hypothetical protein
MPATMAKHQAIGNHCPVEVGVPVSFTAHLNWKPDFLRTQTI